MNIGYIKIIATDNSWLYDTQSWYDHFFDKSCEEIKNDREIQNYDPIGGGPNSPIYSSYSWQHFYNRKQKNRNENQLKDWPDYNTINPWSDSAWIDLLIEIWGKPEGGEDYCWQTRIAVAILQTSDCMLECCHKYVWFTK